MASLRTFFRKALGREEEHVPLLGTCNLEGVTIESNDNTDRYQQEQYANDEVDDALDKTPLMLQDPRHSNGALATRRLRHSSYQPTYFSRTKESLFAPGRSDRPRAAPAEAQSSPRLAVSPQEAAKLYAMSKLDVYTPWAPICQYQTPEACARVRAEEYLRLYSSAAEDASGKAAAYAYARTLTSCAHEVHYVIIRSKGMKFDFGDCQYLDRCPEINAGCRKVHYNKVPPKVSPAVIGMQMLKATTFRNHPDDLDEMSPALKRHELGKLIALQKTWATLGSSTSGVVSEQRHKPLDRQILNVNINELDFKSLGKFGVVMIDPPWSDYVPPLNGTTSDMELVHLPLEILSEEGLLLLWVSTSVKDLGSTCVRKWGYEAAAELVWIKSNVLNSTISSGRTGHWLNHAREICLIGRKGSAISPFTALLDKDNNIVAPSQEASHFPDEIYDFIDRLVGADTHKIELFGRTSSPKNSWMTVEHQVPDLMKLVTNTNGDVVDDIGKLTEIQENI